MVKKECPASDWTYWIALHHDAMPDWPSTASSTAPTTAEVIAHQATMRNLPLTNSASGKRMTMFGLSAIASASATPAAAARPRWFKNHATATSDSTSRDG